jgi:RHS repeat-associated protein
MADANDDGKVDIVELGYIGTYWQQSVSAGTRFDYNGDEYIDIIDLGIVGTWWQAKLPTADPLVMYPRTTSFRGGWGGYAAGAPLCEFGHQGLMHDEEWGIVYNRARMLNQGRFMQRDPAQRKAGEVTAGDGYQDGMNLHEYVRSTPVQAQDASGLGYGINECQADCDKVAKALRQQCVLPGFISQYLAKCYRCCGTETDPEEQKKCAGGIPLRPYEPIGPKPRRPHREPPKTR